MLILLLLLFAHVSSSTATSYRGLTIMQKKIDSGQILRELSFEFSKMKGDNRREMAGIHREVPEGPDPQHH